MNAAYNDLFDGSWSDREVDSRLWKKETLDKMVEQRPDLKLASSNVSPSMEEIEILESSDP